MIIFDSLGVNRSSYYIEQLKLTNPPRDTNAPQPYGPIYIPAWEYRRDQTLLDLKIAISFFDYFSSHGTRLRVERRIMEHTQDMFKIKLMENMVLVHEVVPWLDENEALHRENRSFQDEFKRVLNLVNPFIAFS